VGACGAPARHSSPGAADLCSPPSGYMHGGHDTGTRSARRSVTGEPDERAPQAAPAGDRRTRLHLPGGGVEVLLWRSDQQQPLSRHLAPVERRLRRGHDLPPLVGALLSTQAGHARVDRAGSPRSHSLRSRPSNALYLRPDRPDLARPRPAPCAARPAQAARRSDGDGPLEHVQHGHRRRAALLGAGALVGAGAYGAERGLHLLLGASGGAPGPRPGDRGASADHGVRDQPCRAGDGPRGLALRWRGSDLRGLWGPGGFSPDGA
jgi:hypothetical protein